MISDFGTTADGRTVRQVTIGAGDLSVTLLTLGAIVQDVRLAGIDRSLTLGTDRLADYESTMPFHGPLIGPVANRISTARVRLDGMTYELERNQDGRIHLHSGADATQSQVWNIADASADCVTFTLSLPDGQCGLPGNRQITARFEVTAPANLTLEVTGTTDATTLMNFANHSFWNLDGSDTYDGHQLWIDADAYLPTDADICPTGEIAAVAGTQMDFREPRILTAGIPAFDTNFCLSDQIVPLRDVLRLTGQSGVSMTLATTCPGLQIYDGRAVRRPGRGYYEGLAIEAQHWPDAPNNRDFPSIRVTPDVPYLQTTIWAFRR
jgi:aldose 1-epimerase